MIFPKNRISSFDSFVLVCCWFFKFVLRSILFWDDLLLVLTVSKRSKIAAFENWSSIHSTWLEMYRFVLVYFLCMLSNRFDCIRHLYNSGCNLSGLKGGSVSLSYCSSIVLDSQYLRNLSANNLSEEIKDVLKDLI